MHILLIARHYPPEISGGARRPFLWVKGLRQLGHKVSLITPFGDPNDPDHYKVEHPVRFISSPNNKKINEPASIIEQIKAPIRNWRYWPDPDIQWCKSVERYLKVSSISPEWLITTSPPESAHVLGAKCKALLNCKWLVECRDTWITFPHRKILMQSRFRAFIEKRIANKALSQCDAISTVSTAVMSEIQEYVPKETPRLIIGHFSDTPFKALELPIADFNFIHSGGFTLSDRRRQLKPVLEQISEIAKKHNNLHLHIAGPLSFDELKTIEQYDSFKITSHGTISLKLSRSLQAGADAFLLSTPPNSHALPGKFAEYRQFNKPIYYSGGGDWMSLVDDSNSIFPLHAFSKDKTVESSEQYSYETATKKLLDFLAKQ